jgi:orotate phosphoribosyltransferase
MDIGACTPTFSVYELDDKLVVIVQDIVVTNDSAKTASHRLQTRGYSPTTTLVVIGRSGISLPHTDGTQTG